VNSRRKFLTQAGALAVGTMGMGTRTPAASGKRTDLSAQETVDLCGQWWFRTDPLNVGEEQRWYGTDEPVIAWRNVRVPHTWQVEPAYVEYRGVAWYRRTFDAPTEWQNSAVRIEFEAVFHTATIWVNGKLAGEHARKGYTAFVLDITHLLHWGSSSTITVRVDSAFNGNMLPRGRSSDWAHDGGIYRPVQLLITPKTFVERVDVEAVPDLLGGDGKLAITAYFRNTDSKPWTGRAGFRIIDDKTGQTVVTGPDTPGFTIKSGAPSVKIFGEEIPIRAQIASLEQFSDHADPPELLQWLHTFKGKPQETFLVHGEPAAAGQLRELITKELGWNVKLAEWMQKVPVS